MRLYGKRGASRASPSADAPPIQQPTRVTPAEMTKKRSRGAGSSSADDGELSSPSPKGNKTAKRRKSAPVAPARADAKGKRRADEGSEADVESGSEEGDGDMRHVGHALSACERASLPRAVADVEDRPQLNAPSSPAQRASDASDGGAKSTTGSQQGQRAARATTEAPPTDGAVLGSRKPSASRRPDKGRVTSSRPRGTALQDKSNSTTRESQGRSHPTSAGYSLSHAPTAGRPGGTRSQSPEKASSASRLQVFRDETRAPVGGTTQPELARRPALPSDQVPPRRSRPPRRNVVRHASELPPPVPIASSSTQGAALLPRSPAAHRRGSVSIGEAAKSLLAPPNEAASADPLPRPAPWALSTPASPLLDPHSSSPADGASGLPVFRFTTTEFGDSPSLQLYQPGPSGINTSLAFRGLGTGEAEGMDSSIMLETWDESVTGQASSASREGVGVPDQVDEDVTMRQVGQSDSAPVNFAAEDGDDLAEEPTIRHESSPGHDQPTTDGAAGTSALPVDLGKVDGGTRQEAGSPPAPATGPAAAPTRTGSAEVEPAAGSAEDPEPDDESMTSRYSPNDTARQRLRAKPLHYTSTFMPARHPRWPIDEPLPEGPPSSEDELAYYLRTSGTFSSEDDLPASENAPSDESAKEDWLAEREVGRALKPTSKQREKRIAAYNEATTSFARLRLGEGSGGRRKEWKREILPLDQVRLPRQVREAIEAKAARFGEELGVALEGKEEAQGGGPG